MSFFKKYFVNIICFIILLVVSLFGVISYIKSNNENEESFKWYVKEYCNNQSNSNCDDIIKEHEEGRSFFPVLSNVILKLTEYDKFVLVIVTVIPACYILTKDKRKVSKNKEKITKDKLIKAYMPSLIGPIVMVIIFIICLILAKGHTSLFDYEKENLSIIWKYGTIKNGLLFTILYFLNLILTVTIYANIAIFISKFNKNTFLSIIISIFVIFGIEVLLSIAIRSILINYLNINLTGSLSIINPIMFDDASGNPIFITIIMFILTLIPVFREYKIES